MPKPGTRNILYVLANGDPDEWALARDVPAGQYPAGVQFIRFEDVPDDVCDDILDYGKPSLHWNVLVGLPHDVL